MSLVAKIAEKFAARCETSANGESENRASPVSLAAPRLTVSVEVILRDAILIFHVYILSVTASEI